MDLNQEVWNTINTTPTLTEETKKTLHLRIMRLIEMSKNTPAGKKLGVTFMTQEGSLAADEVARNRDHKGNPGEAKPKSV